jgi:outer membrane protein OmpA-like peptidoglycan-associated protein
MRALPALALISLALAGCAQTGVSLFGGEKNSDGSVNATGALAVLDPLTGQDLSVVDQADASRNVRKNRVSKRNLTPAQLQKKFGGLLNSLPRPPVAIAIFFQEGATLKDPDAALAAVVEEFRGRPGADVQIVGHTDSTGGLEDNDKLSVTRAETVVAQLVARGIPAELIRATGRGEREPKIDVGDEVVEPQNRRVDIVIK